LTPVSVRPRPSQAHRFPVVPASPPPPTGPSRASLNETSDSVSGALLHRSTRGLLTTTTVLSIHIHHIITTITIAIAITITAASPLFIRFNGPLR
jgi:hypothetical protein